MRRHLPAFALPLVVALAATPGTARAQAVVARPVADRAVVAAGRIEGIVRDASGAALNGVSVLALGSALAIVQTDGHGRFSLSLPPGYYILRAALEDYVLSYREPIRVESDVALSRSITLSAAESSAVSAQVSPDDPADLIETDGAGRDHAHTPTAWRLRHLPRTALRDVSETGILAGGRLPGGGSIEWLSAAGPVSYAPRPTLLASTGLQGQVNFLATSAVSAGGRGPLADDWGRGVAYVVVGAPVGRHGDWSIRAAMAPGERTSWTLLGEYQARRDRQHAFRAGLSYSAQAEPVTDHDTLTMATPPGVRRVSGLYGYDRWTLRPGVTVDYGMKVARYDYLRDPTVLSARFRLRAALLPRVAIVIGTTPRMIAPGADQFQPPAAAGAWLPPERTFDAMGGPLAPERVSDAEVGIDADVGHGLTASVRGFAEESEDQIATVFGLDGAGRVGHYHVGSPGSVVVRGVAMAVSGRLFRAVTGRVTYTRTQAEWTSIGGYPLTAMVPSLGRNGVEWGHDLTTQVDAVVPATATRVSVAYRLNNLFATEPFDASGASGRFDVEVRQQLPYVPLDGSEVNLLIAARTLLRDVDGEASYYDELLTVAPPLQVLCGIQMRF